jgi:riboflavin kinase/FMN adenylyltransferase
MLLHFGTELLRAEWNAAVVCVGTFDGVHLGHQALIRAPDRCPKAISSVEENLAQIARLGVAVAVVLHFDVALSQMSAQEFLDRVLVGSVRAESLVVGHDFAMGHDRQGTTEWLRSHIPTEVIPPFEVGGVRVSSSAIRQAVAEGDLPRASRLLGRSFALTGVVVGGQKLGRKLGYPTANIARSFDQVLPLDGIYVADVETADGVFRSAVSIGMRPAVGGRDRTIEAYLLDYPGRSLYGESVHVELIARLRDEANFESLDALVHQIEQDVAAARAYS